MTYLQLSAFELHSLVITAIRNGCTDVALPLDALEMRSFLVAAMRNGCTNARRRLVESHRGFIFKQAARLAKKFRLTGHLDEIRTELWLYAYDVMPKYDPLRGAISTFLLPHFNNALGSFIGKECYPITLPHSYIKGAGLARRIAGQLQLAGIQPSDQNVAAKTSLSERQISNFRSLVSPSQSLDAPVSAAGDGGMTWLDTLRADKPSALDDLVRDEQLRLLRRALRVLNPQELMIIKARFGLNGKEETHTLAKLGDRLERSKERVRQIEAKALRKLAAEMGKSSRPPLGQLARELELA